jgi:hypothetical protein
VGTGEEDTSGDADSQHGSRKEGWPVFHGRLSAHRMISWKQTTMLSLRSSQADVKSRCALLMMDNVSGCESALGAIPDQQAPGIQRLRTAIRKWKAGLSFWQKMRWYWGDTLAHPVKLDFPPGEI